MTHAVRVTTAADADGVVRLLDAAMLAFDRDLTRRRVADGDAVAAVVRGYSREARVSSGDSPSADDRVVGACVLDRTRDGSTGIAAIAVHRSRRGRGIGTTLIDAAATRTDGPLVARFRAGVRPFYESLGFDIEPADGDGESSPPGGDGDDPDRLRGVLR